jgi:hypothetical protein
MSTGFIQFPEDWSGPVFLEFTLYTARHTSVVRYRFRLESRMFDLYVPKYIIENLSPDVIPEKILVAIGRAPARKESIGFLSSPIPPRVEYDLCEYQYSREYGPSHRFDTRIEAVTYSLYVPKEIFHGQSPPSRLYLKIAIPGTE